MFLYVVFQYYTITSNANKLVLGVAPTDGSVKAVIPTHAKPGDDGQLWRDDADTETIRSKTNENYCMDIASQEFESPIRLYHFVFVFLML